MAWSTPATWVAGAVLTAAQLNAQLRDNLNAAFPLTPPDTAWTTFTPTLTQSVTVAKTVSYAKYQRIGRIIIANIDLAITGAGTSGQPITLGLPVAAANAGAVAGPFRYFDAGNTVYAGTVAGSGSATTVQFFTNLSGNALGVGPTFGMANGDNMQVHFCYEAAT